MDSFGNFGLSIQTKEAGCCLRFWGSYRSLVVSIKEDSYPEEQNTPQVKLTIELPHIASGTFRKSTMADIPLYTQLIHCR